MEDPELNKLFTINHGISEIYPFALIFLHIAHVMYHLSQKTVWVMSGGCGFKLN